MAFGEGEKRSQSIRWIDAPQNYLEVVISSYNYEGSPIKKVQVTISQSTYAQY